MRVVVLATAIAAGFAAPAAAQAPPAGVVHDVPYVPQSEALCGGAAAAMVMRFWGATGVTAESFAGLVDRQSGGIHGSDLAGALSARGWNVESFRGSAPALAAALAARRPAVVMLEERPGTYHYVVVIGWSAGRVIVHDPARAPYRILGEPDFLRRWEASEFWTMVARPGAAAVDLGPKPASGLEDHSAIEVPAACRGPFEDGVRLAEEDRLDDARRALESAIAACPDEPAPWREMAGVHALRGQWREAVRSARQATARDVEDGHAWRILATGLFLEGDRDGALEPWNRIEEPIIDLVTVKGLTRTRHDVAARALGLDRGDLLTPDRLRAARRRLADVPSAKTTTLTYQPGESGYADVQATALERALLPTSLFSLASTGVRVVADHELAVGIASPTGRGEMIRASWRWANERPRVMLGVSVPAPFGGVWSVNALDERQSYAASGAVIREARQNVTFEISNWTARGFKWIAGAGVDRFRGNERAMSISLGGEQRYLRDRVTIYGRTSRWFGDVGTWTAAVQSEWRSGMLTDGIVWSARGGAELAGDDAPLTLWPGTASGLERSVILRAHPVHEHDVVTGETFGRRLVHGGVEWRRWMSVKRLPARVAPAWFVDTGRSFRRLDGGNSQWLIDAGVGIRVAMAGGGQIRLDVARGLRDGTTAISVGWVR